MGIRRKADVYHFHDPIYTDIVVARDIHGRFTAYIREEHYNGNHVYTLPVGDQEITEETTRYIKKMAGSSIYRIVIVLDDGSVRVMRPENKENEQYA